MPNDPIVDIYPETSTPASWTITVDTDISAATAAVWLDGDWHDLDWDAPAVETDGIWTRKGSLRVRGADATEGALVTEADDVSLVKLTIGDDVEIRPSTRRFAVHT